MSFNALSMENIPAVILAAGEGSRLNGSGDLPKPMAMLDGQSLLERALLTGRDAGVRDFSVVAGYRREEIEAHARALAARHALNIQVVANDNWREGNGTSALACAPRIDGPFFIMMCDHLLDSQIFKKLVSSATDPSFCYLAVDKRIDRVYDPEDATWVNLEGDLIIDIGKHLNDYNGIDTGLFLCRPFFFAALQNARAQGDASLSGGVRMLTSMKKMKGVNIGEYFWLDVDTPESLRHGEEMLPALTKKVL